MSSSLSEMTAVVGGGEGGAFGVEPGPGDEPVPEGVGVEPFGVPPVASPERGWTLALNGSLLANFVNSVSWPGSGVACTDATIFVAGAADGCWPGVDAGAPGIVVVWVGVVAGADTGAGELFMSFSVCGTSYTSTSPSTAQRTMTRRFCFCAFAFALSVPACGCRLRAIRASLLPRSARTRMSSWSSPASSWWWWWSQAQRRWLSLR